MQRDSAMKLEEALHELPVQKKARRLKLVWPLIEAKLAEGVAHAVVLELLNRNGFDLTEGTYKSYLYRFRKARRAPSVNASSAGLQPQKPGTRSSGGDDSKRPATFEYNPRGIPDLLK